MRELADVAFAQGAFGFSTGLTHVPSAYGGAPEIHALAEVAQRRAVSTRRTRGPRPAAPSRRRGGRRRRRRTGVRVEVLHLAINEPHLWGRAQEVLAVFDAARAEGIDIAFDVHPYDASSSSLTQYLPPWVQEGGTTPCAAAWDPDTRARALVDLAAGWFGGIPWHWDRIVLSRTGPGGEALIGRSIEALSAELGRRRPRSCSRPASATATRRNACCSSAPRPTCSLSSRTRWAWSARMAPPSPSSREAASPTPAISAASPRVRALRADRGALTLADAVAKTSVQQAERIGLTDRGRMASLAADLVVLDAARVIDRATYLDPCQAPVGVRDVIVGSIALSVRDGALTGARPGRVLRAASAASR